MEPKAVLPPEWCEKSGISELSGFGIARICEMILILQEQTTWS